MASLLKIAYLLLTTLACLINLTGTYTLVPGIPVPANSPVPVRLEIRTFIQNPTRLNILLLALESMQAAPTSSLLSFYRISGIHGTNFAWDNDTGGNYPDGYGYCHHSNRLFPPWHRPYLSLFEKTLYDTATTIVQGFPSGTIKTAHLLVLQTWRMPYWDWAMDASLPTIMGATTASANVTVTKMVSGQLRNVTIANPLYRYRLQIPNDPNVMIPRPFTSSPRTSETVRNPTVKKSYYVSRPTNTNSAMLSAASDLKRDVVRALSLSTEYNAFSNMADGADSLEGPHGYVHVIVGGTNGHMTSIELAAFDPIFYFHHANVDRLFALWQALYPDSYLSANSSDFPNQDTPLNPFRKTDNQYWTSRLARDVKVFGYTYPELINGTREAVVAAYNTLYGQNPPAGSGKRKRQVITTDDTVIDEDIDDDVDNNDVLATYNDYIARVKISNGAAKGSFVVCFFFDEPVTDASNYTRDPNFVGCFKAFTRTNISKAHRKLINGGYTLTNFLYNLHGTSELPDMKLETVRKFLKNKFKWRLVGDESDGLDLDGCQINVVTAKVYLMKSLYKQPRWGKFFNIYKVR